MRLLATIAVFFVSLFALVFLGIWVTTLLGGNAWWGMVLIYPELFGAILIAVLFSRRWKNRPDKAHLNGNAP
jgi:hypothetical protein